MKLAMLLVSLLTLASGVVDFPDPPELECSSANEQKFFVYSVDPSLVYPFVASFNPSLAPPSKTKDLVGNTWQGLQLSITQGNTTITQAGGKPLTVTSPNTLDSDGFNVVSEDFCLGHGNWTVHMGSFAWGPSTHPEMGSYDANATIDMSLEERRAPGAPINAAPVEAQVAAWALDNLKVNVYNFNGVILAPFEVRWAIFPSEKQIRDAAEASAASGAYGMGFIEEFFDKAMAVGEVDFEKVKVVPWTGQEPEPSPVASPEPSPDVDMCADKAKNCKESKCKNYPKKKKMACKKTCGECKPPEDECATFEDKAPKKKCKKCTKKKGSKKCIKNQKCKKKCMKTCCDAGNAEAKGGQSDD